MKKETILLEGVPSYSFELTAHKPRYGYLFTPFETYSRNTLWSGARFADMSTGLKIESISDVEKPELLTTLFTEGSLSNNELKAIIEDIKWLLQLNEDVSEFYTIAERYPVLKQCRDDLYGMRDTPFLDVFSGIIVAVTLQNTSWKRSSEMTMAVYKNYGEKIVFDNHEILICPSIEKIAACDAEKFRVDCKLGYRAEYIRRAAKTILEGFPDMAALRMTTEVEAKKKLMEIYGIGEYSAEIITPHPSFRLDSWGAKIFSTILGIKGDVGDYVTKEFGMWRGYVYAYILHNLDNLL